MIGTVGPGQLGLLGGLDVEGECSSRVRYRMTASNSLGKFNHVSNFGTLYH